MLDVSELGKDERDVDAEVNRHIISPNADQCAVAFVQLDNYRNRCPAVGLEMKELVEGLSEFIHIIPRLCHEYTTSV